MKFPQVPLTVGMATYDDYDGVFFTVQSLLMYHNDVDDLRIVVVDNNPSSVHGQEVKTLITDINSPKVTYHTYEKCQSPALTKEQVFKLAPTEHVVCIDCHVLIVPGALRKLAEFYYTRQHTIDLYQGPIYHTDQRSLLSRLRHEWRGGLFCAWEHDERGDRLDAPPFEITAQGAGLFSCWKQAMPAMNPKLKGFGGEEFYLQDRFRQYGGRVWCLPFLRWLHRFARPEGIPFNVDRSNTFKNYILGWTETGRDTREVIEHYTDTYGKEKVRQWLIELKEVK